MNWASLTKVSICIGALLGCLSIANAANTGPDDRRTTLDPDLERFMIEKRALVKQLGEKHEVTVPPIVWSFFDAAQKGDWETASNQFRRIEAATGRQGGDAWISREIWGPMHDTFGAYDQFHLWPPQLLHRFGDTLRQNIPAGSIYFGGTDAGRFIISALSTSHSEGHPFFTLTQNALADASYLDYLRDIYGAKIYVPSLEDSRQAFQEYLDDAQKRFEKNQPKEGESIKMVDGRFQVSGVIAVMMINELLVKVIIDKNPSREIYLEESYALESLYGRSLPHGLIFKVNHQPLEQVPQPVMEADHQFWTDQCRALIGNVVQTGTSVPELCSWSERIILRPESGVFGGNPAYLKDAQAPQYYSQCRSAIAAYYQWWSRKSDKSQTAGLNKEADFAYRQAIALSPYNPTVVWRYVDYLLQNQRTNDAKVLVETTLRIDPEKQMILDSEQLTSAMKKLRAEGRKLSVKSDKQ
jgi:tetratricopeptide (TPR) repeat protein